jgi:hypothetical protein
MGGGDRNSARDENSGRNKEGTFTADEVAELDVTRPPPFTHWLREGVLPGRRQKPLTGGEGDGTLN